MNTRLVAYIASCMRLFQNIAQSIEAIRTNLLRAGITIFIIALGITALVFVKTAISGISTGLGSSFSALGTNTFTIRNYQSTVRIGRRGRESKQSYPDITYRQAQAFKTNFDVVAPVSLNKSGGSTLQLTFKEEETNPNVSVIGTDENYLLANRFEIYAGRDLTPEDVKLARNVIVIGWEVKTQLFPYQSGVGEWVYMGGRGYKVVGELAEMGASGFSSLDRRALIPISTLRRTNSELGSITVNVYVKDAGQMPFYMAEARQIFRQTRRLAPAEDDNFAITKSDAFVGQLLEQLGIITLSAQLIALITLLGASVALLNVMLVSVTERTREIGVRKALGASSRQVLGQFLWEAVIICQIGGILGFLLGVLGGNLVSKWIFSASFVIPWDWLLIGATVCTIVGMVSGFYPARKAA